MIYLFDELNDVNILKYNEIIQKFCKSRLDKINCCKNEKNKKQSIIAYLLLIKGVFDYTKKLILPIEVCEKKPYLLNSNLKYNISHCDNGVAVVLENYEVGIDIEEIKVVSDKLVEYICNKDELKTIKNSKNYYEEFIKLWTKKESYLKLVGSGLTKNLKELSNNFDRVEFKTFVNRQKKYIVTVCSYKKGV